MTGLKIHAQRGFTLVELGVVMVIVGLLIGGLLKGQDLITNSRTSQTMRLVNTYKAAVLTFKESYGGFPGDILDPANRLPNCSAAPCSTAGDGNRIITPSGATMGMSGGISNLITSRNGLEGARFWTHLAVTGLVSGVDETGNASSSPAAYGVEMPAGPFPASGFAVGNFTTNRRNFIGYYGSSANVGALPANSAAAIDEKMDDGRPFMSGEVVVMDNGVSQTTACISAANTTGTYVRNPTAEGGCQLVFFLDN